MINLTPRLTVAQRNEKGREARSRFPRSGHADWSPDADRRDPVDILATQNQQRLSVAGADPACPDGGLTFHLLQGRCGDHG